MDEDWEDAVQPVGANTFSMMNARENASFGKASLTSTFIGKTVRGLGRGLVDNSQSSFGGIGFGNKSNQENKPQSHGNGFGRKEFGNENGSRTFGANRSNNTEDSGDTKSFGGFAAIRASGLCNAQSDKSTSNGTGNSFSNKESGGFGRGGDRNKRAGDWICPNENCGNSNFGFRQSCQKCDTPRSDDNMKRDNSDSGFRKNNFGGQGFGGGGGSDGNKRSGDWTCSNESCGNNNFAFRQTCQKCDTPKDDSGGDSGFGNNQSQSGFGKAKSGGFKGSDSKPGGKPRGEEWICPNEDCGNNNFAFRKECMKCSTPKPGGSTDDAGVSRPAPYIPPAPSDNVDDIFGGHVQKGINFDKYDDIPVEVSGHDQCGFITTFQEAGLLPTFLRNIKRANYERPTPIQKYSIPIIMAGRDLMACAQTGSGKTAAFLLPVLTSMIQKGLTTDKYQDVQYPQTICVAPTRELALQIYNDCRRFAYETDVRAVVLYGGTSLGYQIKQIEQGANIVIGTPGRLLDVINRGKVNLSQVLYLILDEADRMLDMGFEPEIRKLVETMGMTPKTQRQTLMFSATFPEEIQKLASDFLNDYLFVTIGRVGGANTDVSQNFFEVERLQKRDALCDILRAGENEKTLVFVEMKRNADFLASYLCQSGFKTTSIHGDRLQKEREEALEDFKRGSSNVLVATSVAARGLDIPEVMHVVNYDLPSSIDEYVHRIGRTGRCGNLGKATSFFSADTDLPLAASLVRILKEAHQEVPDWLAAHASGMGPGDTGTFTSKFGGKDIRAGKLSAPGKVEDSWAAGTGASFADRDEEEW
ncbi:ATP-dependent RNA helicase DDX4-like isoform X1 [Biomphalaria glabrata]|uniref:RNA helicase n=1 Tax=Biomphalaria glabrata TaxID=6526 RepID=A0A9W3AGX6_BIOGL|nr:ATP-dependent RNA helicase DDX4-like isoform X1 [Biomphalaria glabrata]